METTEFLYKSFIYTLESSIILIVFYVFYLVWLRKETSFQFNRYYLLLTPIVAVLLPFLSLPPFFPSGPTPDTLNLSLTLPQVEIDSMIKRGYIGSGIIVTSIILAYIVGLIIFAYSLGRQLFVLWKLRCSNAKEKWKGYTVIATEGQYPTFSFLGCIFYDNTNPLPDSEKQIILLHESIHLREFHSADILVNKFLTVVFWYNPLFRLFLSATALNHEYLADSKVLATSGVTKPAYRKSLAINSLRNSSLSIGTFFNKSQTLTRIKMMNRNPQSINLFKVLTLGLIMSSLSFVFSCESNETKIDSATTDISIVEENIANSETESSEEVFTVVDEQPYFQDGGNAAFFEYISKNLRYPKELEQNKLEGKVYVEFVIEKDGSVENVQVLKGIGGGADQEAAKVIRNSPRWTPGKHQGEPVRVRMVLPISFKLS